MSMNMPPQPTEPVVEDTMVNETVTPTGEVVQEEEIMTTEQPPQSETNDNQVIEAVAQGLEEDTISAEDIMVAVLSESLGLTPAGASSLFNLLMSELMTDEQPTVETEVVDTTIQEQ